MLFTKVSAREENSFAPFAKVYASKMQKLEDFFDLPKFLLANVSAPKVNIRQLLLKPDSHVPENFCQIKIFPSLVQKNTIICWFDV